MLARLASNIAAALELLNLALQLFQDCRRVMRHGRMGNKCLHDRQPHVGWQVACIPEHMPMSKRFSSVLEQEGVYPAHVTPYLQGCKHTNLNGCSTHQNEACVSPADGAGLLHVKAVHCHTIHTSE